ncbi:MAG: LysE family translocator [Solirubrobacterales bacterium]
MDGFLFLRAIAIGFVVAAPIGPVGILCIRKAMADGRLAAFVAGLGAALADCTFGAVVGLGLGAVSHFLNGHAAMLKTVGGLFMLGLGARTWWAAVFAVEPPEGRGPGMWRDFLSTFLITITNPGTILGVMGVFAALGTTIHPTGAGESSLLVLGMFLGSSLWWLVLTELTILVRARFTPERIRLLNHVSGALLMVFGLGALVSLAF